MWKRNVREISNFNQKRKWVDEIFNCDLIDEGWKINVTCHIFIGDGNGKDKHYLIT